MLGFFFFFCVCALGDGFFFCFLCGCSEVGVLWGFLGLLALLGPNVFYSLFFPPDAQ